MSISDFILAAFLLIHSFILAEKNNFVTIIYIYKEPPKLQVPITGILKTEVHFQMKAAVILDLVLNYLN